MALARMLNTDEDALICDLAETYGIYDWRALPLKTVAVLSFGLSDNSRIKRLLAGAKIGLEEMLMAVCADRLGLLVWANTKDGQKGRNKPKSILDVLTTDKVTSTSAFKAYDSGAAFEAARAKLLGGDEDG